MFSLLRNIIQLVNESRNLHQALRIIVEQVKQALAVDVCSVYLMDDKTKELELMASDGLLEESIGLVRLRFNKGLNEMDVLYLRQRAEDVRDLGIRILKHLQHDLKQTVS